jgi:hypothetical protein
MQLSQTKLPEGSELVVIGTPKGFEKTVTTGIVSGYRTNGEMSLIQITAPISSGSSGSPVFETGGRVIGIAVGGIQDSQGLNFALDAKEIANFLRSRPFKMPTAAKTESGLSVSNAALQNAQKFGGLLSLPEIVAKLEMVRPQTSIDRALQSLGTPHKEDEREQNYYLSLWNFKNNNAILFTWDRNKIIEHSEWVERYATKEEAASRAQTMLELAAQSFGKHSAASQNGKVWKHNGYSIGIEQHSSQGTHMVMFKATK